MKQRDQVAMTGEEIAAFLSANRKVQVATINQDGTPHLVAMYYVMLGGQIAFWTYRRSQKAVNLARDPRLTCLVEAGEQYFDLIGVQVTGIARAVTDPAGVLEIGHGVVDAMGGVPADAAGEYVARAARKRTGYLVAPVRVASWDHRKLLPAA